MCHGVAVYAAARSASTSRFSQRLQGVRATRARIEHMEVPAMQLVVFALGDEEYGLPITQVQEIIRFSEPRSIPNPHASIRGVINLRGRIIPVCDLKLQLDVRAAAVADDECEIVVVESSAGPAGMIVDGVNEVMTVTEEQIEPEAGSRESYLNGIAKVGDRLIVLLDAPGLVAALGLAPRAQAA
jgi:purine-binding chemotaxis protein CheW